MSIEEVHLDLLRKQLPKIVKEEDMDELRYSTVESKKKTPIPNNEAARLVMLRQTQLLDTNQSDPDFDRYVNLTRRIFKTSFVILSLIDVNRQWVKACAGITSIDATIPREHSICSYTILPEFPDVFVVPDATLDERFCDNPYVIGGPKFRFYAGAAIAIDGLKIGCLSILDEKPKHDFTIESRANLFDMAAAISKVVRDARINNMRAKREKANLMLGLNHNLRTPLMSLTVVAEMLRNELKSMSQSRFPRKKPSFNQNQLMALTASWDPETALANNNSTPNNTNNTNNTQDTPGTRPMSLSSSRASTPDVPCMDLIRDLQGSIQQLGLLVEMGLSLGQISAVAATSAGGSNGSINSGGESSGGASVSSRGVEGVSCDLIKVYRKVQSLTQRLGRNQNVTWSIDQSRLSSRARCVSYPDALLFVLVSSLCQVLPHADHVHVKACFVPTEVVKQKMGDDDITVKLVESLATAVAPGVVLGEDGVVVTEMNIKGDPSNINELISKLANSNDDIESGSGNKETIDDLLDEELNNNNEGKHGLFALGNVLRNVLGGSSYLSTDYGGIFSFSIPARLDKISLLDMMRTSDNVSGVDGDSSNEVKLDAIAEEFDSELVKITETSSAASAVIIPSTVRDLVSRPTTHLGTALTSIPEPHGEAAALGGVGNQGPPHKVLNILLVDDSLTVQKILGMWLKRNGCHVVEALNGFQALEIMKKRVFDIVCMDFLMPVMDGLTCIKEFNQWMSADPANRLIPRQNQLIVGLSATALESDEEQAFEAGMHMFCSKPVDMKGLASILDSIRQGTTVAQLCEDANRPKSAGHESESSEPNNDSPRLDSNEDQQHDEGIVKNEVIAKKSGRPRSFFFGAFRSSSKKRIIPVI